MVKLYKFTEEFWHHMVSHQRSAIDLGDNWCDISFAIPRLWLFTNSFTITHHPLGLASTSWQLWSPMRIL